MLPSPSTLHREELLTNEVLVVLEHSMDRMEEPPHDGDVGLHLGLSSTEKMLVEGPDVRLPLDGDQAGMNAARRIWALPVLLMRAGLWTELPDWN
jgi:hypothetical protein